MSVDAAEMGTTPLAEAIGGGRWRRTGYSPLVVVVTFLVVVAACGQISKSAARPGPVQLEVLTRLWGRRCSWREARVSTMSSGAL